MYNTYITLKIPLPPKIQTKSKDFDSVIFKQKFVLSQYFVLNSTDQQKDEFMLVQSKQKI